MAATPSPTTLLQEANATGDLSTSTTLSPDGQTLTILGHDFDASTPLALTLGNGKTVTYSLASVYLQLVNPGVLQYRKACESAKVEDPVKVLDKGGISSFFLGGGGDGVDGAGEDADADASADAAAESKRDDNDDDMDVSDDEAAAAEKNKAESSSSQKEPSKDEKRHRSSSRDHGKHHHHQHDKEKDREHRRRSGSDSKHHHHHHKDKKHHHKDKDRHSKSSTKFKDDEDKKKGSGGGKGVPMTNEQLVQNLGLIVDKREKITQQQQQHQSQPAATPAKEGEGATQNGSTDANTPADSRQITPATTPIPSGAAAESESVNDQQQTQLDEKSILEQKLQLQQQNERQLLLQWLSPKGFEVNSPEVAAAIEKDREATRRITALEIPVGDSSSILRAGAGGEVMEKSGAAGASASGGGGNVSVKKRDFARVLEIYQEVMQAEEKAKRSASSSAKGGKRPAPPPPPSSKSSKMSRTSAASGHAPSSASKPPPPPGNPIIVVPNAMTSCITMTNAGFFFGKDGIFIPRDQALRRPDAGRRGGTISITRRVSPRLGGGEITYDIIDNPASRLKPNEWSRVVAVVAQGASWQFKGWKHSDPVDLFSRSFGFYIGLEGDTVPNELRGWNVKLGKVSRDRRGLDSICLASFWNGLEEFMAVNKQEYFRLS